MQNVLTNQMTSIRIKVSVDISIEVLYILVVLVLYLCQTIKCFFIYEVEFACLTNIFVLIHIVKLVLNYCFRQNVVFLLKIPV